MNRYLRSLLGLALLSALTSAAAWTVSSVLLRDPPAEAIDTALQSAILFLSVMIGTGMWRQPFSCRQRHHDDETVAGLRYGSAFPGEAP